MSLSRVPLPHRSPAVARFEAELTWAFSPLPGKYDGAGAIQRAWDDFQAGKLEDNTTGIMIHYVIEEVDRGEPILVERIECRPGESCDDLANRIHSHEHKLIVQATATLSKKISADKAARSS